MEYLSFYTLLIKRQIMKIYCIIIALLLCFNNSGKCQNKEEALIFIERMAEYPGGQMALNKYLKENTFYPLSALKDSIEGRVTIRFAIDTTGQISDIKLMRGLQPACDSMALSIVRLMPKWIPAKQNGKPVKMYFTLPIIFKIPEDKDRIISNDCAIPTFPGGDGALFEFIRRNLKYPVTTGSCFQGRVIVRFVVNREGKVSNAFVLRGIDSLVDKEAIKVVNMMPDWIPAHKDGKNCNFLFTLPVVFRLN